MLPQRFEPEDRIGLEGWYNKSLMNLDVKLFTDLETNRCILKSNHCDTGSQCKDLIFRVLWIHLNWNPPTPTPS